MKKNKLIRILVISIMFLLIISISYYNFYKQPKQTAVEITNVCIKQQCFDVELAQTSVERERGLMFRENLCEQCGMLFVFEQPEKYGFWMKDTLIPLDIIWINKNKNIVYIKENAQACKNESCENFSPNKEALYVLEINSGLANKYNFLIGNRVELTV